MRRKLFNITPLSIIGTPFAIQFDSHYQNESLYTMVGMVLQTRDGKENPPRWAAYYIFEGEKYPLCYGFCSVLFSWGLKEAYNRAVIAHPNQKVVLSTPDLIFDFEEFIPVDELCEQYLNIQIPPYKKWIECSPKLKQFTETDDALYSYILFAEYDYFCDFFNRGIFEDFSKKQKSDFLIWWLCIVDYITKRHKIEMLVKYIPKRVIEYLSGIGALNIPKGMTMEEFCDSASTISVDRTITNKHNQQFYQINIMPTCTYHDNAIHNDNSKTINVTFSKKETLDLIHDFLNNEYTSKTMSAEKKRGKRGKRVAEIKPYTIKYICPKEQKPKRLQLLRQKWEEWNWIKVVDRPDDFDDFFEGTIRDCNLTWTGANEATLYALLQAILRQSSFIEKQPHCSARSIGIGQFKKENMRADSSRVSTEDKERINISIYLLNPSNQIPQPRSIVEQQPDISDVTLKELLGQTHVTRDLNKQF